MLKFVRLSAVFLAAIIVAGAVSIAPVRAEETQESAAMPTEVLSPTEPVTTLPSEGNLQLNEYPESELSGIYIGNIQELAAALGTANVTIVSDTDLYLNRDILVNDYLAIYSGTYNLDFRGFHISGTDFVNITGANVTLFDSSASQSGGIHEPDVDTSCTWQMDYSWEISSGSLTIKSGTYTGKDALFHLIGGALKIEDGNFTSQGVNEWSPLVRALIPDKTTEPAQLNISGGSFEITGETNKVIFITGNAQASISNATMKSDYIAVHSSVNEGYLHIQSGSYYGTFEGLEIFDTSDVKLTGGTFSCDPNGGQGGVARYGYNAADDSDTVFSVLTNGYMYNLPFYSSENYEIYGYGMAILTKTQPKVTVISNKSVEGFVDRLYTKTLGRHPDLQGFQNWVSQLKKKTSTGSGVAFGFFFSPEFIQKKLSDADFVTLMYRVFFNREPDATGKKNWLDALDKGVSRKYVFAGFANSQEWKGLCDQYKILPGDYTSDEPRDQSIEVTAFVQRLYTLCLSRKADNKGMNDWTAALNSKKQDGAHVAYGFFFSSEFTKRNLSNGDYVEILYQVLLGRASDSSGKAGWVAKLKAGTSRLDVFRGFAHSQEFEKICAQYGIVRGTV